MTAARVRLRALLLAVLVGLSGLVGASGHLADRSTSGHPAPAVAEADPHVLPDGDAPAIVQSASDHQRSSTRQDAAPLAVLGVLLVAATAVAAVPLRDAAPAVPSRATAHVRRRGPPSFA